MRKHMNQTYQRGFNLLEVVIAIVVFVVGMLALASLQGALTRTMVDAKVRTEATNLAEQTIEQMRGFSQLLPDANEFDYSDIVDDNASVTVNGVSYAIDVNVTDYWYTLATDNFTTTSNGQATPTFKQVEVEVTWDAAQMLRDGDGAEFAASQLAATDMSGKTGIKVTGIVNSLVTGASARVAETEESDLPTPPISYQPGQNPDVVALNLGNNRFKESLLPQPEVIRSDKVETTFDVITYATVGNSSAFLRREEFTAVSCDCTMRAADADNPGRRPMYWAGDEYAGGQFVTKIYGESATNQQSDLCDTCCRDHHDGGSATEDSTTDLYLNVYGPFKADSEYNGTARASNHKHYKSDGTTLAGIGDTYEEVCRMVRVNGFMRVTQDFRREDQYVFPEDFLDDSSEVNDYSSYVTTAASTFYGLLNNGYPTNSPPCIGLYDYDNNSSTACDYVPTMQGAPVTAINSGELPSWTSLEQTNNEDQQLRSRGVYIDYVSNDLRLYMKDTSQGGCIDTSQTPDVPIDNCCVVNGSVLTTAAACDVPNAFVLDKIGAGDLLPVLPFFDVQSTFLNNWRTTPSGSVVTVTDEALDDFNAHSRGEAEWVSLGSADTDTLSHRGNTGFTNTPAIDPLHASHVTDSTLTVCALDSAGTGACSAQPPPSGDPTVTAEFTDTVNPNPSTAYSGNGDAVCQANPSANGFECEVPTASSNATVTIDNYGKNNRNRWACSSTLTIISQVIAGTAATTTFQLVGADTTTNHVINIQETACSP